MKQKAGKTIRNIILMVAMLAIGFTAGIGLVAIIDRALGDVSFPLLLSLLLLFLAYFLNIILHEAGHMVMGLLTGYRFLSFRIFSLMVTRMEDGSYKWSRFSIPGTLGQCLLIPPELDEDKMMPYILYNLGGIMVNFLIFIVSALIYFLTPVSGYLAVFVGFMGIVGLFTGLTNGIPLGGEINNDGSNIHQMNKNRRIVESLWKQLTVNAYQTQGKMFTEMPEELFTCPKVEEMKSNNLISAEAVFTENRLMEEMDHNKTLQHINWLLDTSGAELMSIYRIMLNADRILLQLLQDQVPHIDKDTRKNLKQFSIMPNVLVTRYAIATLFDHDEKDKALVRKQYEKTLRSWPYRTDLITLPKYMNEIDSKALELNK